MQLHRTVSLSVIIFGLLTILWFRICLHVDHVQKSEPCLYVRESPGESRPPSDKIVQEKQNCTCYSHIQRSNEQQVKSVNKEDKVQVIIITRWRYGSSFTGGLFDTDPGFIYFFEPLLKKVPMDNHRAKIIGDEQVGIVHDILKCNFVNAEFKWWDLDSSETNCLWSQDFGGSPLCGFHMKELQAFHNQKIASHLTEELCQSRKHVAIKTVRVPDISYLKSILLDKSLNVKIIHLVRDPRGVYLSRETTESVCDMELRECDELEKNLNFWENPPSWLKGRHMLLRYEDLASNPLQITQTIYKFLGLKVPVTVKLWLGKMATLSNSTERAFAWRYKIRYSTMRTVQQACLRPMNMVGYLAIDSKDKLKDPHIPTMKTLQYPLLPSGSS